MTEFSRSTREGLNTAMGYDSGMSILYANIGRQTVNRAHELRYFEYYSLAHLYAGRGVYEAPGQAPVQLRAGQGILICPGYLHYYGQVGDYEFWEDNLCFAGPVAEHFRQRGFIRNGILPIGEFRALRPICELVAQGGFYARTKAGVLLQSLLLELFEQNGGLTAQGSARNAIEELLHNVAANPERWWTVNEMAENCNLELERFRRIFQQTVGIRPKEFLDNFKMTLAKNWLEKTEWTVEFISSRLGYHDRYHFSRRFKQVVGIAPEFYRREVRQPSSIITS